MATAAGQTVVIASEQMLSALRAQFEGQANALVFSEADFVVVLEMIIEDRPAVVALDPLFAATARGAALVSRIKADPRLKECEVRTLAPEMSEQPATTSADGQGTVTLRPLGTCGTRRAQRFEMRAGVEAKINGMAGRLVNLSITGSQLLSPSRGRPAEGIRVTLSDHALDLRLTGTIAWVSLEIAARASAQRYRFGVEFRDADAKLLESFCLKHKLE